MAREVRCPAGVWTTILSSNFSSIPASWVVHFAPEAAGEVEVKKSSWIFPNPPQVRPLEGRMVFDRGFWNTFFKVSVRPAADVTAEIQ